MISQRMQASLQETFQAARMRTMQQGLRDEKEARMDLSKDVK